MEPGQPEAFSSELVRTNFARARLYATVLLLLHLPLLALDLFRLVDGVLDTHPGYNLLFYAHVVVVAGLGAYVAFGYLRPIKPEGEPGRGHDLAWRLLIVFLLLASAAVSLIDQLIHGQITVYIIGALGISVGAYIPFRFALPLYTGTHVAFLGGLTMLQKDPDLLVADIINGTLVVALALVISRTLFAQRRRNHEHLAVIEEQRARLARLATEDSLTGLPNRRSVLERVEQEFERRRRYGPVFSVAVADLDHFKTINDTYTHTVGDEVLRRVAAIFRSQLRTPDVVARYGGEEFLFLFPESTREEATSACEKIRRAISDFPWDQLAPGLQLTTSVGVAYSDGAESAAAIIAAADRKLYEAKRAGRNCVRSGHAA